MAPLWQKLKNGGKKSSNTYDRVAAPPTHNQPTSQQPQPERQMDFQELAIRVTRAQEAAEAAKEGKWYRSGGNPLGKSKSKKVPEPSQASRSTSEPAPPALPSRRPSSRTSSRASSLSSADVDYIASQARRTNNQRAAQSTQPAAPVESEEQGVQWEAFAGAFAPPPNAGVQAQLPMPPLARWELNALAGRFAPRAGEPDSSAVRFK